MDQQKFQAETSDLNHTQIALSGRKQGSKPAVTQLFPAIPILAIIVLFVGSTILIHSALHNGCKYEFGTISNHELRPKFVKIGVFEENTSSSDSQAFSILRVFIVFHVFNLTDIVSNHRREKSLFLCSKLSNL